MNETNYIVIDLKLIESKTASPLTWLQAASQNMTAYCQVRRIISRTTRAM